MRKLIWTIALIAAFAVPALAQQAQKEVNLKVNDSDVAVIGEALGKLPFEKVAPLINKLQAQIVEQQVPRKVEPAPAIPDAKKE